MSRLRRVASPVGPVLFGVGYAVLLLVVDLLVRSVPDDGGAAVRGWASTSLDTLTGGVLHAVGALVLSAFVPEESAGWWAVFALVGCWVTGRAVGVRRAVLVGVSGQVVGTLLSEGLLAVRIGRGDADEALRGALDIGPSYVVVALLVAGVVGGRRFERAPALVCFGLLAPYLFDGLTGLDVTAVGHTTAVAVGAGAGFLATRRAARPQQASGVRR
ncbi:rhomboid-like protein [Kineosporia sp. A_224]|uniref:rhomboid-like protein n=1 Tax=Kineosporia sp. A_224 TaxID=1962180 RepID=UPI000B4C1187|nr:rhomboid-like protein [Kineosporia sp. A_224]